MALPDTSHFPKANPGPYERQMGEAISRLLDLFKGHVPDANSNACVAALIGTPDRWSAGHAVFDEVRRRLLTAKTGDPRAEQYTFEETCCQAVYNAKDPPDPFDASSAFFVAGFAFRLARRVGLPADAVVAALLGS